MTGGSEPYFHPTWTMQIPKSNKVSGLNTFSHHYIHGLSDPLIAFVDRTKIFVGSTDGKKLMTYIKAKSFHRTIPKSMTQYFAGSWIFQGRVGEYFIILSDDPDSSRFFFWSIKKERWFTGPSLLKMITAVSNIFAFNRTIAYFFAYDSRTNLVHSLSTKFFFFSYLKSL